MKDTDYLSISTRVRAMENRLFGRERRERMIDARTDEEALKILAECGYAEPEDLSVPALNRVLTRARADLFADLRSAVPQPALVEVFQIKYDYHNLKVLVKAEALGEEAAWLLMAGGRYDPGALADAYRRGALGDYPEALRRAAEGARETLNASGDPQAADLILDRACYEEMTAAAKASGSAFLQGYVRLAVDAANLRTAVRCQRMGAGGEVLAGSLLPGGNVEPRAIAVSRGGELSRRFAGTPLEKAAELGAGLAAPGAGNLTGFEKCCDDALNGYLSQAKRVAFGEAPVVAYLCAREAEATAIRTILAGRKAGLSGDAIRERMRESYV